RTGDSGDQRTKRGSGERVERSKQPRGHGGIDGGRAQRQQAPGVLEKWSANRSISGDAERGTALARPRTGHNESRSQLSPVLAEIGSILDLDELGSVVAPVDEEVRRVATECGAFAKREGDRLGEDPRCCIAERSQHDEITLERALVLREA